MMNRRNILKSILGLGIGIGSMPLFSQAAGSQARRLILVELSGANDGLNTLVPYRSDLYHQLRPTLSLRKNEVTSLHADIAMHKDLDPMMKHWDNGDLAWVQGLGYPHRIEVISSPSPCGKVLVMVRLTSSPAVG